jgi:membrane protein
MVRRLRQIAREFAAAFGEHHLWTYTSAISFRAIVALVPLTLLGLGLLSALGLEDVWTDSIAPVIREHATPPVYTAIDYSVDKIFSSSAAPLIAFAAVLLLWDMAWAVTTMMEALNEIHDVDEPRPWWRRYVEALVLAGAVIVCLVGAVLLVVLGPRASGVFHVVFGIGRWPVAFVLLGLAVGLLVRYAPAEHPQARWASAGSILVVGSWIVASVVFEWWVSSVANFETAIGSLAVFLVLSAYVFVSVAIFLIGVQLDEIVRREAN